MKREYFKRQSQNNQINLNGRLEAFDSLAHYSAHNSSDVMLGKVALLSDSGRVDEAISLIETIISDRIPAFPIQLKANAMKAELLFDMQRYAEAFKEAKKLLCTPKPDSLGRYDVVGHIVLTNIFMRLGDAESALKHFNQAENIFKNIDRQTVSPETLDMLNVRIMSCQAWMKLNEGDTESAFGILEQALEKCANGRQKAQITNNIGFIFTVSGEYGIANQYFKDAIRESDQVHRPSYIVNYIASLADRHNWEEVLMEASRYEAELKKLPDGADKIKHFTALAEAYYHLGKYQEACSVLMKQQQLQSTVFSEEFCNNLSRQIHQYEVDRLSDADKEEKASMHRRITWLYVVSGILAAFLAALCTMLWRLRRHSKQQESQQRALTTQCQEQTDEAARKDESLCQRNKELAALSMKTAMISDSLTQIGQMAADRTCTREQLNDEINLLIKKIQREENIWEMFNCYFGQVNPKFFDNLYRLHPSLTPAETRMCAFILTGLTVKEIAILTNRSNRTIESIRYTLRKKLGINGPTESYMRYLSTLSAEECDSLATTRGQSLITCNPATTTPTNLD